MSEPSDEETARAIAARLEQLEEAERKIAATTVEALSAWIQRQYGIAQLQAARVAPLVYEILSMLGLR